MVDEDQATDSTRNFTGRSRRVQAVDHAVDVLQALGTTRYGMSVSEVARRCGMSKAATYHLLLTLETRRFVARDIDSGLYQLSWALYELGSGVAHGVQLTRVARRYLDVLAAQIGEPVLLGILDSDVVLYLDRGEARAELTMVADAGRRFPLHSTASGKVLLAFSPDPGLVERILSRPLRKTTGTTISDPEVLRRDLARVRSRGFATCWQEGEPGLCSVAMPVRDYSGYVIASVSIVGTHRRLNVRTLQQHLVPLRAIVRAIEARLDGLAPRVAPDVALAEA